uniref:Uncharacterized protein n=1 Tax=Pseudoalteromonas luteoviolacea TaxID=43657 RepID=A0A023Q136_9GAMM|nr:hypothetical protein [Pseudoalteromonas luteoviolacea]
MQHHCEPFSPSNSSVYSGCHRLFCTLKTGIKPINVNYKEGMSDV